MCVCVSSVVVGEGAVLAQALLSSRCAVVPYNCSFCLPNKLVQGHTFDSALGVLADSSPRASPCLWCLYKTVTPAAPSEAKLSS